MRVAGYCRVAQGERARVVAEYKADVAKLLALIRQQALTTRGPSPLDDLIDEQFDVLRGSLPDRIKYNVTSEVVQP